ncbi:MAG TPA: hypothetical protein VIJ09_05495 [Acidimicrobiales bacterium]
MAEKDRRWPALGHRDVALLWSGQSASLVGDGIFTVALALETLRIDSRPPALSLVMAARLIPTVALLLVGGVVVDRVPRRLAMLGSDLVRGSAVVPELLPADLLVQGSALNAASQTGAQNLIGPALVGSLWPPPGRASLSTPAPSPSAPVSSWPSGAGPPWSGRAARSTPRRARACATADPERWLWMSITGAGLVNFAALSPWPSPSPCSSTMSGAGAVALGLVFAAAGLGGVLTWVAVGRRGRPRRRITAMWVGWGGAGLAVVGLGLAPDIWVVAVAEFFVFALVVYGNVLWHPLMQQLVPAEMIGRPRRSTISSRSV